jgi:rhamnogalacturonyl hydrolase YesR
MTTALDWQLKNPKHELCDWTNGAFSAGVFAAWETTGSKKYGKPCTKWAKQTNGNPDPACTLPTIM